LSTHDAFSLQTATRPVILKNNTVKKSPITGRIVIAMGLRRIGLSGHVPEFSLSSRVGDLYRATTDISWKIGKDRQKLCADFKRGKDIGIDKLMREFGKCIWDVPLAMRDLGTNPDSHLVPAGEEPEYAADLYYDCAAHRE
jgi:hypothetical protein